MTRSRAVVAAAISIVLAMIVLPAAVAAQTTVSLTVADASVAAGATTITVPGASLGVDGYIVVHEGDATSFGAVIGSSALMTAGSYTNVVIQLDRAIVDGEYLWPMLHSEDNANGVYDDAATDAPVSDGMGNANFGGVMTFAMQLTVLQAAGLSVADATVATGATTITVPVAALPVDGYIVVHEGDASSFGPVVGSSSLLVAGSYNNVVIQLDRAIVDGEYLWPMLHSEDNGNGTYDDAATDAPIADAATGNANFGGVVTFPMQLSVQTAPVAAPAGNAGLSSDDGSTPWLAIVGALAAASLLLVGARRVTGRRA